MTRNSIQVLPFLESICVQTVCETVKVGISTTLQVGRPKNRGLIQGRDKRFLSEKSRLLMGAHPASFSMSTVVKHCATSRKVAGSFPDCVINIFHWRHPSSHPVTLGGSTRPLTEMITKDISWGKGGRCVGLTPLPPSCADCLEFLGASTSWSSKGLFWS